MGVSVERGIELEMTDEPGEFDEASDRARRQDQHESAPVALQCLVGVEEHPQPAGVHERHAGDVDAYISLAVQRRQGALGRSRAVCIEFARQHEDAVATLGTQRTILGSHLENASCAGAARARKRPVITCSGDDDWSASRTGTSVPMTRVMIAVDGSHLDGPLAATAYRLFGPDADYWAVNVQSYGSGALGAAPTTFPAVYGGSFVGFGSAYPYLAPNPSQVRDATATDDAMQLAATATEQALVDAGMTEAETVAEVGDPPTAIIEAAREHDIDVIVVGDHDRGWWSKLFQPALGDELVDQSEFPVLVISTAAADSA